MRGSGIRLGITAHNPPARLLDLTRLIRRAGRVMTGIDRVELAYLRAFAADDVPCWALVRTRAGYVLLPPDALPGLLDRFAGRAPWPAPAGLSQLERADDPIVRAATTFIRSRAAMRCIPALLGRRLSAQVPEGTDYFNVGHSNLTPRVLRAARTPGGRVAVFIHDVIPSDYPHFQRPGVPDQFTAKLRAVQRGADTILCNSSHTATRTRATLGTWGEVPRVIVSPLGTELPPPGPAALPAGLPPKGPYFVTLGTIEPRKNHALLLDVWDALGAGAPHLVICGSRGWNNAEVFKRLDTLPQGARITEVAGLPDAAIGVLLQGARGLLFPSFAEGFGLPAIEAAALGVPIVASDLPALREVLGNIPVYASPNDRYQWEKAVKDLAEQIKSPPAFTPPTWEAHFKTVLTTL